MSQQRSPNEDMLMAGAIFFILGLITWGIWHVLHVEITSGVRWVRWAELWIDKFVIGDDMGIVAENGQAITVAQWRAWLRVAPANEITTDHISLVTQLAVLPLRPFFAAGLGAMALYIVFYGSAGQYRRRMNLESLIREQAKSFPSIQPFIKFDPRKGPGRAPGSPVPKQLPLFAEALSPEEWIAYNEIPYADKKVDHAKTWQALSLQLGRRWKGPEAMPLYMQGLFAAFALKAARKRKDSEALLGALSLSWSAEKGFRPSAKTKIMIRKAIRDPKIGGALAKFANQHAFETTAMLRALMRARQEGGVLAPAEFVWLRGVDRNLWYPLNNLGRKSYLAESAGAMVHFTGELIAQQAIASPRLNDAVKGIEDFLKSRAAREIPPLDRGGKAAA
jgi:intracellular multiplication protein IcmP